MIRFLETLAITVGVLVFAGVGCESYAADGIVAYKRVVIDRSLLEETIDSSRSRGVIDR